MGLGGFLRPELSEEARTTSPPPRKPEAPLGLPGEHPSHLDQAALQSGPNRRAKGASSPSSPPAPPRQQGSRAPDLAPDDPMEAGHGTRSPLPTRPALPQHRQRQYLGNGTLTTQVSAATAHSLRTRRHLSCSLTWHIQPFESAFEVARFPQVFRRPQSGNRLCRKGTEAGGKSYTGENGCYVKT